MIIYTTSGLALLWALFHTISLNSIKVEEPDEADEEMQGLKDNAEKFRLLHKVRKLIAKGANAFLFKEYSVMSTFILLFGLVVFGIVDLWGQETFHFRCYATVSFIVGAYTSILCGYIGMRIAVSSNYKTTYKCIEGLAEGFRVAYQAGCVMGFTSVGLSLSILLSIILIYQNINNPVADPSSEHSFAVLMELIAGYGLGGSSMALFGRVGGGIFTKAADVGADLVGKVEQGLAEDDPSNPATIADNVGDNVGDIAGMGSDLFGSFAESTCAALVVIANTPQLIKHEESLFYPLLISAVGIVACFFTSIYGIYFDRVDKVEKIEKALKNQLTISTVLVLIFLFFTSKCALPETWTQVDGSKGHWYYAFICTSMGLVSGLLIGYSTDYYTSNAHQPVREMAYACEQGAALNVIFGLALGYLSTIIPVVLLAVSVLVGINLLGMLGVALAAIGMLSTLSVGLAIDVYGPISDNAGGLAEMCGMQDIRVLTDALDAAGNTTAAIGKGFAIGSAALVSLALYGAFITRSKHSAQNPIRSIEITDPWIFCSLLIGAMLPYAFSAMTMKSVGSAAQDMVNEVRRQFRDPQVQSRKVDPDYQKCIEIATTASLREMVLPGLMVMGTPILMGVVFHPILVAGLLPGALLSGVQLAISMSNTGGAWDNTKKLIETGQFIGSDGMKVSKKDGGKGTQMFEASVIGDTIGDPLKDTSGPSLNILVKLMAIISLVFAGGFARTSLLSGVLGISA